MHVELQKEHHWLQQFVGEWAVESEMIMGPDQPPMKTTGSEVVRSLGGVWVLCDGRAEMPGGAGEGKTVMTLGYDPAKKRFVGTFIASIVTHLWVYDGELDASGKVLTLDTEGPNFTVEGKMARFQDIITLESADYRILRSQFLTDEGTWVPFMTAHYRRVK